MIFRISNDTGVKEYYHIGGEWKVVQSFAEENINICVTQCYETIAKTTELLTDIMTDGYEYYLYFGGFDAHILFKIEDNIVHNAHAQQIINDLCDYNLKEIFNEESNKNESPKGIELEEIEL